jgi:hypothetical protein
MNSPDILQRLSARLPELEWKLSTLGKALDPKKLPRGLFKQRTELTSQSCVDEIKFALDVMKKNRNENSVHHLAERVSQQINVLVALCQQHEHKKTTDRFIPFGLQAIGTRQHWLQSLQKDIERMTLQEQSMRQALQALQADKNLEAILSLQAELGKAKQQLTLAKEAFERATAF